MTSYLQQKPIVYKYNVLISGDNNPLEYYEEQEVRASLAVDSAILKYLEEYGHPIGTLKIDAVVVDQIEPDVAGLVA